ncbi:cell division protein SepF [Caldicellulosiruptoraceae bacterium PP1]
MLENIQKKVFELMGIEITDTEQPSTENATPKPETKTKQEKSKESKVVSFLGHNDTEVTVYNLKFFDEVSKVSESLRENKIVLFNLEQVADDQCQRIIDFVSGSVYVLDAKIHKVSKKIFVAVPRGIDLEVDEQLQDEIKSKGFMSWLK